MKPIRPWTASGIVLALALAGLAVRGFMPRPIAVDPAPITRGPLEVTISEEARTRLKDRYVLSAPVAGTACRSVFDVGDPVSEGQVLATIRPLPARAPDARTRAEARAATAAAKAAVAAARQRLEAAVAETELARSELGRLEPLGRRQLVPEETVDRARAALKGALAVERSARYGVEVAEHELEAARTRLAYTGEDRDFDVGDVVEVRAPVSGAVLAVEQACEGIVTPGDPLLEIGDTRSLEVIAEVLSADAVRIAPGMTVRFERWGGGAALEGIVRRVEPVGFTKISALGVEEQRVIVVSDFVSPESAWARLGDGYRLEAEFVVWRSDDALKIPAGALFRVEEAWAAFRIDRGRARLTKVDVGRHGGTEAEVVAGLSEAQQVIAHPPDAIRDGVRVRPRTGF